MGDIVAKSGTGNWLTRIAEIRKELIETARDGDRIAAAFAQADARAGLIASLNDPAVTAKLLRVTSPDVGMVELANNPTEADRVRICAIAILSGFTPGDDEFAIFGGGKNKTGKLYVKEAGFRVLFAHLGIVPDAVPSYPEWSAFGDNGKKVWRVGGSAWCDYRGERYAVAFDGESRFGLPGYETDNVDGVRAKARRRLLQSLWSKVSPILTSEQADDTIDAIPAAQITDAVPQLIVAPVALTPIPNIPAELSAYDRVTLEWDRDFKAFSLRHGPDNMTLAIARRMRAAGTHDELLAVVAEIGPLRPTPIGQREYEQLMRYRDHLTTRPQEVPA